MVKEKCNTCRYCKYCERYCFGMQYEQGIWKTFIYKLRSWILSKINLELEDESVIDKREVKSISRGDIP